MVQSSTWPIEIGRQFLFANNDLLDDVGGFFHRFIARFGGQLRTKRFEVFRSRIACLVDAVAKTHDPSFLGERLPHYKQPKWIRIVDDLPCTATGKVRKAELRRVIEEQPA